MEQLTCEICGMTADITEFQRHLAETHGILFCQHVGLVSKKINLLKDFIPQKPKKVQKKKGEKSGAKRRAERT